MKSSGSDHPCHKSGFPPDDSLANRRIIFNSYNTTGAGPAYVTKFILKALENRKAAPKCYFIVPGIHLYAGIQGHENLKIIKIPVFKGFLKYAIRVWYDFFFLPVASVILNSSAVVTLANYAPMKVRGKKIVCMRHPFLVDDRPGMMRNRRYELLERFRRIVFALTLKSTDVIIVQSHFMKHLLLRQYKNITREVYVLPNPLSNLISRTQKHMTQGMGNGKDKIALYVSRYYPHKNHLFLLELAKKYKSELIRGGIRFYITIDDQTPEKGARQFLSKIHKLKLDDVILNLGEIENEKMSIYYQQAKCLFFPSLSETFGNPLIEAMASGLPVVAADLDYVRAVCEESAVYYQPGSVDDAFSKLSTLMENESMQKDFSRKGIFQAKRFPSTYQWIDEILTLI